MKELTLDKSDRAYELGRLQRVARLPRSPVLDKEFMQLLQSVDSHDRPMLLNLWLTAWDIANLYGDR